MQRQQASEQNATDKKPGEELDARAVAMFRFLAGEPADRYVSSKLLPAIQVAAGLREPDPVAAMKALYRPETAFKFVLSHYGLGKRATGLEEAPHLVFDAMRRMLGGSAFTEWLESEDSEALWVSYVEVCEDAGLKPMEDVNRPIIEGVAELNFEIFRQRGEENILVWMRSEAFSSHRVDHIFERLTSIRNLGPKTSSLLLRDAAFLLNFEERVHYADRLYLQPVTSGIRRVSRHVVPEAREEKLADWVLAGKIAKYARLAEVSGVRFNMGAVQALAENIDYGSVV